ncbi:9869_t:CDS:1, partial [Dentiscutata erythropus]
QLGSMTIMSFTTNSEFYMSFCSSEKESTYAISIINSLQTQLHASKYGQS